MLKSAPVGRPSFRHRGHGVLWIGDLGEGLAGGIVAAVSNPRGRRVQTGRRLALAASVVGHLGAALALFWHLGAALNAPSIPAMNVELARPSRPPPRLERQARQVTRLVGRAAPNAPPETTPIAPRPFEAPLAAPPPGPDADARAGLQAALRRRFGCDHAGFASLSAAERQDCLERLARNSAADVGKVPATLNLDRRGDFAASQNPVPYLNRRPKNGCKAMAAGDQAPDGRQGPAAGVGCAFSF
jgi:hypothetical protein